jgi:hypothetical protein
MRRFEKTFLAVLLGTAVVAAPAVAHARHWRPHWGHHHHHVYVPAPLIGLGIAGAVIGTVAAVDAIVRPRVVYAPPPPPPPVYPYDEGYRRGYDDGRRDAYEDRYR